MLLPENFGLMGLHATRQARRTGARRRRSAAGVPRSDGAGAPRVRDRRQRADRCGDPRACGRRCWCTGPTERARARYDKIHLFRFTHGDEDYDEAKTIVAGSEPATFAAPCGRVGLSICYDLRFPELYRALGDLALIVVPAAFTARTGEAHWEALLRARAIENQCYVLAAAQAGTHPGGRRTWGHSMFVGPWGDLLDVRADGAGIVAGIVEPPVIAEVRNKLPALQHRTLGAR